MDVDGSCYCGAIAFEAEIRPAEVTICHCTDCQRLSGTTFRISAPAPAGRFRITRGVPKEFVKVAASGARRVQAFCPECGTALFAKAAEGDGPVNIRAGTLRQRLGLAPSRQIWRRSAPDWVPALESLKTFDEDTPR